MPEQINRHPRISVSRDPNQGRTRWRTFENLERRPAAPAGPERGGRGSFVIFLPFSFFSPPLSLSFSPPRQIYPVSRYISPPLVDEPHPRESHGSRSELFITSAGGNSWRMKFRPRFHFSRDIFTRSTSEQRVSCP